MADAETKSAARVVPPVWPAPSFPFITTPILADFKKPLLKQWDQRWVSTITDGTYIGYSPRDCNPLLKYNGLKRAIRPVRVWINQSILDDPPPYRLNLLAPYKRYQLLSITSYQQTRDDWLS